VLSVAYVQLRDPTFHQTCIVALNALLMLRTLQLLRYSYRTFPLRVARSLTRIFLTAWTIFVCAFWAWNLDTWFCERNRAWRLRMDALSNGWVVVGAWLWQWHAWWHIGTAIGMAGFVVWSAYLRQMVLMYDDSVWKKAKTKRVRKQMRVPRAAKPASRPSVIAARAYRAGPSAVGPVQNGSYPEAITSSDFDEEEKLFSDEESTAGSTSDDRKYTGSTARPLRVADSDGEVFIAAQGDAWEVRWWGRLLPRLERVRGDLAGVWV